MTHCRMWTDALHETALGTDRDKAFDRHLVSCGACGRELARRVEQVRQLDEGVSQLANAPDPVPDFRERLLAHVPARRRRASYGPLPWVAAAALATLAGFALLTMLKVDRRLDGVPTAATLMSWRSPTQDLLHSPVEGLLQETPRLGDFFFPITPSAPEEMNDAPPATHRNSIPRG